MVRAYIYVAGNLSYRLCIAIVKGRMVFIAHLDNYTINNMKEHLRDRGQPINL